MESKIDGMATQKREKEKDRGRGAATSYFLVSSPWCANERPREIVGLRIVVESNLLLRHGGKGSEAC